MRQRLSLRPVGIRISGLTEGQFRDARVGPIQDPDHYRPCAWRRILPRAASGHSLAVTRPPVRERAAAIRARRALARRIVAADLGDGGWAPARSAE